MTPGRPGPEPVPPTPREPVVEVLHGTAVEDPYRWLEQLDAPRTRAWVEAQRLRSDRYLTRLPGRDALEARLRELHDFDRFGLPVERGGRYFFNGRLGLQEQPVLYWAASLDAEPLPLLDANLLSADQTTGLVGWVPSEDGRFLAYGVSQAGSDWQEWRVRDVATGRDTGDELRWIKFSRASWTHEGAGFFYSRYDAPPEGAELRGTNRGHKVYYHRLGTPQADDRLVHSREDRPEWNHNAIVTQDGRYLVIAVAHGSRRQNGVLVRDLGADEPILELTTSFDARYAYVGNRGRTFFFSTDRDAPLGRVIAVDLDRPRPEHWREVVPETADTLGGVLFVGGRFVCIYLRDAQSRVVVHESSGALVGEVALPGPGSVGPFSARASDAHAYYHFQSFTSPPALYRLDVRELRAELVRASQIPFDPHRYTTHQVFFRSRDGTRIPMFLTHRADLSPDGETPTYLTGYGGFRATLSPRFSVATASWLELGGLAASVNLRGGGEYGREWHEAGMKLRKQNVFDDFASAAEWLVAEGYTRPGRIAIGGRSNGGLLVGALLTQRPELFGAAVASVGLYDMLRFDRFTIGWAWRGEYGSPEDAEEFAALLAYSPYHNVRPAASYPASLIATADHDDRVFPAHSYKFAAALQAAQTASRGDRSTAPILLRVERRAGHGRGRALSRGIAELADRWAFVAAALGLNLEAALR